MFNDDLYVEEEDDDDLFVATEPEQIISESERIKTPWYKSIWFWVIIIIIILLLVAFVIILIYIVPTGSSSSTRVGQTQITFNSQDAFPIEVFPSLPVTPGQIVSFNPPVTSTIRGLSFNSSPTSNFIIFNKNGLKGVGVSGTAPQLIINTTVPIGSLAFKIYELTNISIANVTVSVTCTDNTIASTVVNVNPGSNSYVGISTSLPNISNVILTRNNNTTGPFGISIVQFGSVIP